MIDDLRPLIKHQPTAALTIWQNGQVKGTFGPQDHRYLCHSIRKSILASLVGIEVEAGRLDLSATLEHLGIDDDDALSAIERQATVYDLLTARSGIYHPAGYETEWMGMIKERRHSHAPGTFWCYNNWDFNALGTIYVQASGHSVAEGFTRYLATPLGLPDFRPDSDAWVEAFPQSRHDAYPFRLSNRDLLRFCQLYLQGGVWQGQQVLPRGWTQLCTLPNSDAGPHGAYGYMWWLERNGCGLPHVVLPRGSYMAIGAGGHYALVMPDRNAIVLHRVDTERGDTVSGFQFGSLLSAILLHLD